MSDIRGILACVEYDDLLRITLPRNLHHFQELLVVTSPKDERTKRLVEETPGVRLYVTDAFYRNGGIFNRGLAVEEAFDVIGRRGWMMHLDADIILPTVVDWSFRKIGNLYTPQRYILADVSQYADDLVWASLPLREEHTFAGYCQLFHASDPRLVKERPWYGVDWPHCGGADSDFESHWPERNRVRPDFQVLHLGEDFRNWFGRATDRVDQAPVEGQQEYQQLMERLLSDTKFRHRRLPR